MPGLIRAVCKWNRIDSRALGVQGDGLSRSAVVLETFRVKHRIGVVAAAGGAEFARVVIGDVVAGVDNRSRAITPTAGAACQDGVLEAGEIAIDNGAAVVAREGAIGND